MFGRKSLLLLAVSAFACSHAAWAADLQTAKTNAVKRTAKSQVATKTKKRSWHRSGSQHLAHKLIPPPPAYMPSILPELYYHQNVSQEEEAEEVATANPDEKPKLIYVKNYSWGPKDRVGRSTGTTWP